MKNHSVMLEIKAESEAAAQYKVNMLVKMAELMTSNDWFSNLLLFGMGKLYCQITKKEEEREAQQKAEERAKSKSIPLSVSEWYKPTDEGIKK